MNECSDRVSTGDTIITKTFMGENRFKITRVTATLAMSKRESDGYEHKFKRFISSGMGHPYRAYDTTSYRVERLGNKITLNHCTISSA
tara:strand:- start:219 stop:482 length:264 start_codon:yes stop_codon:yes gene_type:complete